MRFDLSPRVGTVALVLVFAVAIASCADFHRGPAPDGAAGQDRDGAAVVDTEFETTVYPVLLRDCSGCHSPNGQGAYTALVMTGNARMDRTMVVGLVTPGNPDASLLMRRGLGESHSGGSRIGVGSPEHSILSSWIAGLSP